MKRKAGGGDAACPPLMGGSASLGRPEALRPVRVTLGLRGCLF
jgi:hypothetical protein